ncbi:MAG: DNA methyltransferase, partial [Candidatus Woesearchaeota archaeon]|nr:DNA methyltransferase [Candidatus Woesearchaeota archaeon]
MKLFLLSKENLDLAKQEVLSLTNQDPRNEQHDNLLVAATNKNLSKRLAYTKAIYKFLFAVKPPELEETIERFPWNTIYKDDFCVRGFNLSIEDEKLANQIWPHLEHPKTNLTNPKTTIHFFKTKKRIVAGLLQNQLKDDFESRKAHNRPVNHPTSLHPKLARCMINLTGIEKGTIVDPFCGSGGILLEASLLNLEPIGYDTEKTMIQAAKTNLAHFKTEAQLINKDALTITTKFPYIATDLPYAVNSRSQDLKALYTAFIKRLDRILTKRAVIGFPHFFGYNSLLEKTDLKI